MQTTAVYALSLMPSGWRLGWFRMEDGNFMGKSLWEIFVASKNVSALKFWKNSRVFSLTNALELLQSQWSRWVFPSWSVCHEHINFNPNSNSIFILEWDHPRDLRPLSVGTNKGVLRAVTLKIPRSETFITLATLIWISTVSTLTRKQNRAPFLPIELRVTTPLATDNHFILPIQGGIYPSHYPSIYR